MKKALFLFKVSFLLAFAASCGPAAENRENMHARAKVVADSLANMIKTKMAEAEALAQPAPATTVAPTNDTTSNPAKPK